MYMQGRAKELPASPCYPCLAVVGLQQLVLRLAVVLRLVVVPRLAAVQVHLLSTERST